MTELQHGPAQDSPQVPIQPRLRGRGRCGRSPLASWASCRAVFGCQQAEKPAGASGRQPSVPLRTRELAPKAAPAKVRTLGWVLEGGTAENRLVPGDPALPGIGPGASFSHRIKVSKRVLQSNRTGLQSNSQSAVFTNLSWKKRSFQAPAKRLNAAFPYSRAALNRCTETQPQNLPLHSSRRQRAPAPAVPPAGNLRRQPPAPASPPRTSRLIHLPDGTSAPTPAR